MLPKSDKPPSDVKSCMPISVPIIPRLLVVAILNSKPSIGFRQKYSVAEQAYRITDLLEKALEEKLICSIFLDVIQTFNKI